MHIDPNLKEDLKSYLLEKIHQSKLIVTIVSAYPLEQHEMNQVAQKFEGMHNATIKNEIDKSILAGYIIKFGTKMIDLSLKRRLEDVSMSLLEV